MCLLFQWYCSIEGKFLASFSIVIIFGNPLLTAALSFLSHRHLFETKSSNILRGCSGRRSGPFGNSILANTSRLHHSQVDDGNGGCGGATPPIAMKSMNAGIQGTMTMTTTTATLSKTSSSKNIFKAAHEDFHTGDWAGHAANFDPYNQGSIIPVPEHYVPDSMIEWGQIPNVLEVLTSEMVTINSGHDGNIDDKKEIVDDIALKRVTVTVLPEVGCGVDNLDTMIKKEDINLSFPELDEYSEQSTTLSTGSFSSTNAICEAFSNDGSFALIHKNKPVKRGGAKETHVRLECAFASIVATDGNKQKNTTLTTLFTENEKHEGHDASTQMQWRTRVVIPVILHHADNVDVDEELLVPTKWRISSPITIIRERKTSNVSTNGEIAVGGGLDGRTVTRLIGIDSVNKPFVDKEERPKETSYSSAAATNQRSILCLPGGIKIQYKKTEQQNVLRQERVKRVEENDERNTEKGEEEEKGELPFSVDVSFTTNNGSGLKKQDQLCSSSSSCISINFDGYKWTCVQNGL